MAAAKNTVDPRNKESITKFYQFKYYKLIFITTNMGNEETSHEETKIASPVVGRFPLLDPLKQV